MQINDVSLLHILGKWEGFQCMTFSVLSLSIILGIEGRKEEKRKGGNEEEKEKVAFIYISSYHLLNCTS